MKWSILLVSMLLLAACAQTPTGEVVSEAEGPIKVGVMMPLTGDLATIGQSNKEAISVAVQEVNNAGGVNGRPIELLFEDTKCNGKDASNAASKLINVDNVEVIIGALCSGATMSATGLAEQTQTLLISPCSSAPAITDAGEYIFRTYPSDTGQGIFSAQYLYENGYRRVAILSILNDWGMGIKENFIPAFEALGGEVVGTDEFDQTSRDLRTSLAKMKNLNPDALYFLSYQETGIVGLKQLAELDWDVFVFGGDGWSDPTIPQEAGPAADGARFVVAAAADHEGLQNKMQGDALLCSHNAYDTMKIVANALKAGAMTGPEIKDWLNAMPPYSGYSGVIDFDENGDIKTANYVVKEYQNGEIV